MLDTKYARACRPAAGGLDVVPIHHHMTDTRPVVIFLHYYGTEPAVRLA